MAKCVVCFNEPCTCKPRPIGYSPIKITPPPESPEEFIKAVKEELEKFYIWCWKQLNK